MHPLQSLTRDHELLLLLTEALDAYVAALEANRDLTAGDLGALVDALRTYADYRHFEKEEHVLVPHLVRSGFKSTLEVFAEAEETHQHIRHLIEVLYQSAEREPDWDRHTRRAIAAAARDLSDAQRRLAAHEEIELFPEILTRLDDSTLASLAAKLSRFDEWIEANVSTRDVRALSRDILSRYRPAAPQHPKDLSWSPRWSRRLALRGPAHGAFARQGEGRFGT